MIVDLLTWVSQDQILLGMGKEEKSLFGRDWVEESPTMSC